MEYTNMDYDSLQKIIYPNIDHLKQVVEILTTLIKCDSTSPEEKEQIRLVRMSVLRGGCLPRIYVKRDGDV